MESNRIGLALGVFLTLAILFSSASNAFNKGGDEGSPDGGDPTSSPEFKQMLRERELEYDRSRKNLEERERQRQNRQGKFRAHIHASTDSPTSADGSEVVATIELSKEEYEKKDFSRVLATARANKRLSRMTGSAEAAAAPVEGAMTKVANAATPTNRTLLGLSILLVAGGAWWFARPKEAA